MIHYHLMCLQKLPENWKLVTETKLITRIIWKISRPREITSMFTVWWKILEVLSARCTFLNLIVFYQLWWKLHTNQQGVLVIMSNYSLFSYTRGCQRACYSAPVKTQFWCSCYICICCQYTVKPVFFRVPFISRISRAWQVRENNGPQKFEYSSVSV